MNIKYEGQLIYTLEWYDVMTRAVNDRDLTSMSWFFAAKASSSSHEPAHHTNESATGFRNPWDQSKGLLASGQVFTRFPFEWAKELHESSARPCKLVTPDFGAKAPDDGVLKATWLGHAVRWACFRLRM